MRPSYIALLLLIGIPAMVMADAVPGIACYSVTVESEPL